MSNETEALEFLRSLPELPSDIDNDTIRAFIEVNASLLATKD